MPETGETSEYNPSRSRPCIRNTNRPGGTFGNLLSAGNNPWGGSDPGWVNASPTGESGVFPIPNSNFPGALGDLYGHGPHLIKWTSPIAGTVSVTGVLEQLDSSQRHMGWALSKNGGLVAEASIFPTNNAGELNAFGPQVIDVGVGDTIEFVTKYFDTGEGFNAWVSYGLTVEQVVPEPTTIALLGIGSLLLVSRRKSANRK